MALPGMVLRQARQASGPGVADCATQLVAGRDYRAPLALARMGAGESSPGAAAPNPTFNGNKGNLHDFSQWP